MKRVAITGANRGIGLEMVKQLSANGDEILACIRSPETAVSLEGLKGVSIAVVDVSDPASCEKAATAFGPLDLLVCNAGQYRVRGRLDDPNYTAENWAEVLATNVSGAFFTTRAFLPFLAKPGGKIAIISSRMGSNTDSVSGGSYIYRASKAAATNLASNLAVDLKQDGVAVGAYHPGHVGTDMGGETAPVTPSDSAAGLLNQFHALSLENTGTYAEYNGNKLSY